MKDFIDMLIECIMDSVEEFFASLTAPSTKFTFDAFVFSLIFLCGSIAAEMFGIPTFVQWQEALTCSTLMFIIVCIDTSVRGKIKAGLSRFKSVTDAFTYTGEEEEDTMESDTEYSQDDFMESVEEMVEVHEDGTGSQ